MSKDESKVDYFNEAFRHGLVQDFSVSFYNRTVRPNIAQKNLSNGTDAIFVYGQYDAPRFESLDKSKIASYEYNGSPLYSYHVKLRDERFNDLDGLLEKYSDIDTPPTEKLSAEKELYRLIRLLMKEERIPNNFKIQPFRDAQIDNLATKIERIAKLLDNIEKRTKNLEELAERGRVPR